VKSHKHPNLPLIIFSIPLLIIILAISFGCQRKKEESSRKTEKTETKEKEIKWVSPATCGTCHSINYQDWNGTMHNEAFNDPLYLASLTVTQKDAATIGKEEEVMKFCVKCHAPLASFTNHLLPFDGSKMTPVEREGIQCDFCHRVTKVLGDNTRVKLDLYSNIKRGPYKDSYSNFHRTAYSKLHTTSEFCSDCHNVTNPINGLAVERTYDEWQNSVYSGKEGHKVIHCQDCHMKPEHGYPADIPVFGVERKNFYRHDFAGGNTWITGVLGATDQQQKAIKMLQSAAKLSVGAHKEESQLNLKVTVFNEGAGHKLPTGFPEGRLMWLHVIARDAQGIIIFESGAMDASGKLSRTATDGGPVKVYEIVPGIKQPDGTVKKSFHLALNDSIVSDNRIPPQKKDETSYNFSIPAGIGLVNLEVSLRYQSASKEFVDFLTENVSPGELGSNLKEIWQSYPPPVVEMEKVTKKIPSS